MYFFRKIAKNLIGDDFMEKFNQKTLGLCIIVISVAIALIIVTCGFAMSDRKGENNNHWVLQSYGNNVALYNGDEIIEVYGSIVLDTLPDEDKKMLDNGISFISKHEAVMAIEDYDG